MPAHLDHFLAELKGLKNDEALLDFCRKRLLHGTPFVFQGREDAYYEFRKRIAEKYSIGYEAVVVTGSGKLGFSPHKKTEFSIESDIDVAITSTELFEEFLEQTREYQMNLRDSRETVTSRELEMYHQYLEYIAIGWIRPDKLPNSFRVNELRTDWFEFFKSISYGRSEVGNYKVTAGVFRSTRHLELYTLSGIKKVHQSLILDQDNHEQTD